MNKIKILYVVSTLRNSGPTNQLLGKISNLDKMKFEIKVLTLSPDPKNNRRKDFDRAEVRVDSLNLSRLEFMLRGKRLLRKYINNYNPDIVHTTGIRADKAVSILKTNSKHCMTVRNFAHDDYVAKYGSFVGEFMARSNIIAMENADFVICCSKSLKVMYSNLVSRDLLVVQNGVDTRKFYPLKDIEDKKKLRKSLKLPENKRIFIVLGSLIDRKDPLGIINAFKKANTEKKSILILLGDGELMDQCRDIADTSIILKGNVSNVSEYLQASDVYVSASKSEGLPNSVLEAGRCGIKMILSDIPQHREVFEKDSSLVQFFNLEYKDELIMLIRNEICNNNNFINYKMADFIKENFSNNVMSKKYEEIYKNIIYK
ncbi:glycosyltransferase [Amphibacillus sp. MSJ-3]|uniref:glycosyltransferase n=1 Tax=Amphibacillus sp. MSJ-3 TaxID=2841505 RepID=UPI001C0EB686|nr:glycosyltransferase [Amphibacillus sp. MSJ-3]MBU5594395.1 glycosyltransferase [Amphibacillus sp. MSJ-3]